MCSILKEENEDILNKILSKSNAEIIPIEKELFQEIELLHTKINGVICIAPSKL